MAASGHGHYLNAWDRVQMACANWKSFPYSEASIAFLGNFHAHLCARRRHRRIGHGLATQPARPHGQRHRSGPARPWRQWRQWCAIELLLCSAAGRSVHLEAVAETAAVAFIASESEAAA